MGHLTLAMFAVASALTSPAAPRKPAPPPLDAPPPASLEVRDVEAWANAYLRREAWTLITHDTEGARFIRPERVRTTAPSLVEAEVRTELFQPVKMGAGLARSGLARWSVDCAGSRYAVLSMTIFSHNNMQGELARKDGADKAWMTPNESQTATIAVICKTVPGKTLERPLTPQKQLPL